MSDSLLPQQKAPRLIVVTAFDRDESGDLQLVFGPAEQQTEDRAVRTARGLAGKHASVIAWSRDANPSRGEYGEPTTLFVVGDVPDME
ncbi:hypothetical protein LB561_12225 [Mesorhizobium sp. B292B1B]|uniref:hypothetical protein n=1 Tax=unclassified Mesorhizobium TaxID=325217 RepID=UPI0015E42E8B|nr:MULTISPECIES: hypothetical protein [unclassified Mesorhizobium]MCA0011802.1 hypothetical protein [Mesorhizobium sp. B294B1A1]MCA0038057.1 hypothetical protein [Mesorhizobium sp. B292B1B]